MDSVRPQKDLPAIIDAGTSGLKLQATLPKALPSMPGIDTGTGARALEVAKRQRDIRAAYDITRAQAARSKAIQRMKDRSQTRQAKNFGLRRR